MFLECQWLILFEAENICFLPPWPAPKAHWNQWKEFCWLQRPLDQAWSLLWFTISLLNTTEQEIFVSSYFSFYFATHFKTSLKARHRARYTAQRVVPRRQLREPLHSSEAQVQVVPHFLFLWQRLLLPGSTAASLQQLTTLWSVNWALKLLHPHSWSLPACPQQIIRPATLQIQHWT